MFDSQTSYNTIIRIIDGIINLFHFFPSQWSSKTMSCPPSIIGQASFSNSVIPAGYREGQVVILSRRRRICAPSESTQKQRKPLPISHSLRQSVDLHLPFLPSSSQVLELAPVVIGRGGDPSYSVMPAGSQRASIFLLPLPNSPTGSLP
jgi:hypothetical protein